MKKILTLLATVIISTPVVLNTIACGTSDVPNLTSNDLNLQGTTFKNDEHSFILKGTDGTSSYVDITDPKNPQVTKLTNNINQYFALAGDLGLATDTNNQGYILDLGDRTNIIWTPLNVTIKTYYRAGEMTGIIQDESDQPYFFNATAVDSTKTEPITGITAINNFVALDPASGIIIDNMNEAWFFNQTVTPQVTDLSLQILTAKSVYNMNPVLTLLIGNDNKLYGYNSTLPNNNLTVINTGSTLFTNYYPISIINGVLQAAGTNEGYYFNVSYDPGDQLVNLDKAITKFYGLNVNDGIIQELNTNQAYYFDGLNLGTLKNLNKTISNVINIDGKIALLVDTDNNWFVFNDSNPTTFIELGVELTTNLITFNYNSFIGQDATTQELTYFNFD